MNSFDLIASKYYLKLLIGFGSYFVAENRGLARDIDFAFYAKERLSQGHLVALTLELSKKFRFNRINLIDLYFDDQADKEKIQEQNPRFFRPAHFVQAAALITGKILFETNPKLAGDLKRRIVNELNFSEEQIEEMIVKNKIRQINCLINELEDNKITVNSFGGDPNLNGQKVYWRLGPEALQMKALNIVESFASFLRFVAQRKGSEDISYDIDNLKFVDKCYNLNLEDVLSDLEEILLLKSYMSLDYLYSAGYVVRSIIKVIPQSIRTFLESKSINSADDINCNVLSRL